MIYLLLCILSSTAIVIIFKFFERYDINNLVAIAFNYVIAASVGVLIKGNARELTTIIDKGWLPNAIVFGVMFIALFNVLGLSARKVGVSASAVAFKMGVIIPVIAAGVLYPEQNTFGFIKVSGIVLALVGVVLSSLKKEQTGVDQKFIFLPIILFLGSGFLDAFFEYTKNHHLPKEDLEIFSSSLFGIAGIIGIAVVIFEMFRSHLKIRLKDIIGGFFLGVPNFFSIYFLYKALDAPGLQSSMVFPVNNMAIVALSAILALVIFKERLSMKNWLGVLLALVSILMISFG